MKKLSLLLVAFAVALLVSAAGQLPERHSFKHKLISENAVPKADLGTVKQPAALVSLNATSGPEIITEQPEGELKKYVRSGDCLYTGYGFGMARQSGKTNVVFGDNGLVYIQNPLWWFSDNNTWVYGTFDESTGIISVPTGQYLSWREDWGFGLKLAWGHTCIDEVVEGDVTPLDIYGVIDRDVTMIFFQIEDDKITLLGSEGDLSVEDEIQRLLCEGICGDWSDEDNDYIDEAIEFNTVFRQFSGHPAVPADPIAINWYDCGDESGFSYFEYELPTEDVDGNALDPECLSYSIYTDDDKLFTFEADSYTFDLTDDLTEIPFSLYDVAVDFHPTFTYFYYTNEGDNPLFTRRIGIQAIYTVDDGTKAAVRNVSNIVYYDPTISGIERVEAELDHNAPIYNIMGQRMRGDNLPAGIYIQNGKKFVVR